MANHIDRTRFAGAVPGNLTVDFLAIVFLKLHVAPAAAQVEILKREPQRIHLLMAHRAAGIRLMLLQQFAERLAAIGVFVGIELRHFQRRWRRRIIEDMPQCPGAAIDHPVVAHPREHGLDARLAQQTATTRIITAQLGLAQIGVGKPFIAVMPREAVVHHRPITIDQLARRTVVFEHLRDVGDGLLLH